MFIECILLGALIFVAIKLSGFFNKKRLPRGPQRRSIYGNVPQLRDNVAQKLTQWTEEYGNLYTIHLGTTPVVVFSDLKQIREVFGKAIATSRLNSHICTQGQFGIGYARKDEWLEQKNFCMQNLRLFGFDGATELEFIALQEVNKLCLLIDNSGGMFRFKTGLMESISQIYLPMINHTLDSTSLLNTIYIVDCWINVYMTAKSTGLIFLPRLKYLTRTRSDYNLLKVAHQNLRQLVLEMFETRLASRDNTSNSPKDLIDALIDKIEKCEDPKSSFYQENGRQHAYGSVIAFLLGSCSSTGTFITWAIYYLVAHPEAQLKVQQEIDYVTERKRLPNLGDRPTMRYLNGVMLEILRMTTIADTGSFIELEEDVHVQDYILPKGQIITSFLHYIHNDRRIWGDPQNFRPWRYLENPELRDFVVAFQPGQRSCPGQQTAGKVSFLYLAVLLQKYSFEIDPSVPGVEEYLKPIHPHILRPKDLPIVVKLRE